MTIGTSTRELHPLGVPPGGPGGHRQPDQPHHEHDRLPPRGAGPGRLGSTGSITGGPACDREPARSRSPRRNGRCRRRAGAIGRPMTGPSGSGGWRNARWPPSARRWARPLQSASGDRFRASRAGSEREADAVDGRPPGRPGGGRSASAPGVAAVMADGLVGGAEAVLVRGHREPHDAAGISRSTQEASALRSSSMCSSTSNAHTTSSGRWAGSRWVGEHPSGGRAARRRGAGASSGSTPVYAWRRDSGRPPRHRPCRSRGCAPAGGAGELAADEVPAEPRFGVGLVRASAGVQAPDERCDDGVGVATVSASARACTRRPVTSPRRTPAGPARRRAPGIAGGTSRAWPRGAVAAAVCPR